MMQPRMQFVNLCLPDSWPTSADEFWRIVDQHQAPRLLHTWYKIGCQEGRRPRHERGHSRGPSPDHRRLPSIGGCGL
jgi:hypothetical protein